LLANSGLDAHLHDLTFRNTSYVAANFITPYMAALRKPQQRAVSKILINVDYSTFMSIHLRIGGLTSQHSGRQTRDISLKHSFARAKAVSGVP